MHMFMHTTPTLLTEVQNFPYTHVVDYVMVDAAKGSATFLMCTCGALKSSNYR